jgi:excisionase family DNA binding protein
MGAALMRQHNYLCLPHEAAQRLGISVDEVLDLIATGELAAVMYMDDDRWFIDRDSLDRMARKARRQDARPDGRVRTRAALSQFFERCLDAIS